MSATHNELPKLKSYSKDLHTEVIYAYIVQNKTQPQIAEAFSLDDSRTVSSIVRAYNFNREKSANYQGGKDKGKYRGTDRELVRKYVHTYYPGFVADERITFDAFLEQHRKKPAAKPPAPPRTPFGQSQRQPLNTPKPQYAAPKPVSPAPKPVPPAPKPPTAAELFHRANQLWQMRSNSREMVELFKQAAELGHAEAPYLLAVYYQENGSSGGDCTQALSWFQTAANRGCEQARRSYAEFHYELALKAKKYNEYKVTVPAYEKAARAGHAGAANNLGVLYANGEGVAPNVQTSVYWYDIAAKGGNTNAMWNLAHCCLNGAGLKKSRQQALYWFEQAAERKHLEAAEQVAVLSHQIGERYWNAKEEQERPKAFAYFRKATDYGNQDAFFDLGLCYANGIGVAPNAGKAAEYYGQAARNGSAAAQNNLGVLYARGEGVNRNDQQAAHYYEQAANQGDPVAMKNIAYCYKEGKGCEKNAFQAVYWFEQAAERGDDEARLQAAEGSYAIGEHYLKSKASDEKGKACDYFRKALKYGNNKALLQIGNCLENGYGVKQSYEQAVHYYEQARAAGIDNADAWLADCYFEWAKELLEEYSCQEAVELLEKGAKLEHEDCMLLLAACYFEGNGVYADDDTSAEWYAAAGGVRLANKSAEEHYVEVAERCYANGDYQRGVEWYKRAAELDCAAAMEALGNYYSDCDSNCDVPDYEQAARWYRKANETGDCSCDWDLNRCYLKLGEQALEKDDVEAALGWYRGAGEIRDNDYYRNGLHECCCRLAKAAVDQAMFTAAMEHYREAEKYGDPGYEEADHFAKIGDFLSSEWEYELAAEWYEKASGLGHEAAAKKTAEWYYSLARRFESEQDHEQTLYYYLKAAEAGDITAQLHLGYMYEFGKGVPADYEAAFKWYNLAAEQGDGTAQEWLGDMLKDGKAERHYGKTIRLRMAIHRYEQAVRVGNENAGSKLIDCSHVLAEAYAADMDFQQAAEIYRKSAELGSKSALHALGLYSLKGTGVPLDYGQAAGYFRHAAEREDERGRFYLDRMFGSDGEIAEDYRQYEQWYRQAVELGDPEAMRNLGLFYMAENEERKDYTTAVYWLEQAVKLGDEKSIREVVEGYYLAAEDYGSWSKLDLAFPYYIKAAESGHIAAQTMVGHFYERGIAVPQNEKQAARWYGQSAKQGCATGQYYLGALYEGGRGVARNDETAAYWLGLSARQGNTYAKFSLAVMYMEGRGVPADLEQAEILMEEAYLQGYPVFESESDKPLVPLADLYTKKYGTTYGPKLIGLYEQLAETQQDNSMFYELGLAYEMGYCPSLDVHVGEDAGKAFQYFKLAVEKSGFIEEAIVKLGNCYRNGVGTEQDIRKAVEVLESAAYWSNPEALNVIGECYFSGKGIERDLNKTFEYCSKAAELGHAEAQYNVGFCYENGYGVPQNKEEAMEWYGKSAEQGFALAVERLTQAQATAAAAVIPEYTVDMDEPEAAVDIDESLDVNELIRLMGRAATKEEQFYYRQIINEKLHSGLYGSRDGKEPVPYGEQNEVEIREFDFAGEKISYAVTAKDRAAVTVINDHVKIYVPGDTLIIDKEYARQHLSAKAISYAIEENEDYLWDYGGTGTAVVFELASILDEEPNVSIMYMNLLRSCRDYLQEFELFGDKFKETYEQNLQRKL
ncbi:tetratricopeptide repeat protein [Paenibacillus thalictri]|nr:tetratricopeptide repeat protein [Paenibacillus thalictri]